MAFADFEFETLSLHLLNCRPLIFFHLIGVVLIVCLHFRRLRHDVFIGDSHLTIVRSIEPNNFVLVSNKKFFLRRTRFFHWFREMTLPHQSPFFPTLANRRRKSSECQIQRDQMLEGNFFKLTNYVDKTLKKMRRKRCLASTHVCFLVTLCFCVGNTSNIFGSQDQKCSAIFGPSWQTAKW